MLPNTKFIGVLPIVLAASFYTTSAYAEDAISLLNHMNEAIHKLEYSGKLVFIKKDSEPKTLEIEHSIDAGVEKEMIRPLDANSGEPVEASSPFSLNTVARVTPEMQEVYSFDLGSMSKVAGRPCRIIIARPKDRKRYLQKYCIDEEWGVLLQYSLINQQRETVERFMFTDFTVYQKLPDSSNVQVASANATAVGAEKIAVSAAKMVSPVALTATQAKAPVTAEVEDAILVETIEKKKQKEKDNYSEWFFDPLPAGFKMISTAGGEKVKGEEHIIVTDGLGSVSIFIMKGEEEGKDEKAQSSMESGALNILTQVKDGYTITLVGEVPKVTLQDIFAGLKRATIK